jgi:hypothetical protein
MLRAVLKLDRRGISMLLLGMRDVLSLVIW